MDSEQQPDQLSPRTKFHRSIDAFVSRVTSSIVATKLHEWWLRIEPQLHALGQRLDVLERKLNEMQVWTTRMEQRRAASTSANTSGGMATEIARYTDLNRVLQSFNSRKLFDLSKSSHEKVFFPLINPITGATIPHFPTTDEEIADLSHDEKMHIFRTLGFEVLPKPQEARSLMFKIVVGFETLPDI
ncbi:uncharacterized protein BROUX77_006482 [Berkeleyomyces rouxiae]|uniref:uncharacterized protein n=1 Tax=Berkeleyomyces rouxiae TaxID=2035830 RepID=UPI003B81C07C